MPIRSFKGFRGIENLINRKGTIVETGLGPCFDVFHILLTETIEFPEFKFQVFSMEKKSVKLLRIKKKDGKKRNKTRENFHCF